jgi:hypothetical protein
LWRYRSRWVLATMIVPSLPSLRQTSAGLAALGTMYFALIGLGFMFVEIGIIQRVSIFLGIPSTVLRSDCSA